MSFRGALALALPPITLLSALASAPAAAQTSGPAVQEGIAIGDWTFRPSLELRLRGRGTEPHEVVTRRLETAKVEMDARGEFDEVVVNDELEVAVDELVSLLVGQD